MNELIQIQKQLLGFRLNVISHDRQLIRRGHVMTVSIAGKRSEKLAFLVRLHAVRRTRAARCTVRLCRLPRMSHR